MSAGMSEGEILERMVDFAQMTLNGVGVFFSVISAYAAALYYFINRASFSARLMAFIFLSVTLAILGLVFFGASNLQSATIATLEQMGQHQTLTPASLAAIKNSGAVLLGLSTDVLLRSAMMIGFASAYLTLFYLTLFHTWRFDAEGRVHFSRQE